MHYLTRQRLHLSQFHLLMKVLMSLYVLSVGAGLWVATLKYSDRAEWSPSGLADFVHGDPGGTSDEQLGDPLEGLEGGQHVGKSRRELVDIAHPHLFTVPIVLFILGHLLHLTRLPDLLKLGVNVTAFVSFLGTFLLPFFVVEQARLAGALYVCGWALLVSCVVLCVVPLYEMWLGKPGAQGFDALARRARTDPSGEASGGR